MPVIADIDTLAPAVAVTPRSREGTDAVSDTIAKGRELYARFCEQCHQPDGLGVTGRFPPIIGSRWVTGPPEVLVRILLDGLKGPIRVEGDRFDGIMPGSRDLLTDSEIGAVATYIRQWKLNAADSVEPSMVRRARIATAGRGGPWTAGALEGPSNKWLWLSIIAVAMAIIIVAGILHARRESRSGACE
jgi:mono/diheme cytochrome c family protein